MQTGFNIRGIEEIQAFFRKLPRGSLRAGMRAFGEYILGNEQRGLRHSEPYKYVSRESSYSDTKARFRNGNPVPKGYFSAEQFFYVMSKIRTGEITPGTSQRTGESANAWTLVEKNNGYKISLQNQTRAAFYTRADKGQARQPAKVGWRKTSAVVAANTAGAMRAANAAVKKWIADNR